MIARLIAVALAGMLAGSPDQAAAQPRSGVSFFPCLQADSKDPLHVAAETRRVSKERERLVTVSSGHAVMTCGDTVLKAAGLTLYASAGGMHDADNAATDASRHGLARIEAIGPAGMIQAVNDVTVSGDSAVVDLETQCLTFTGKVVLTHGHDLVTGDRVVVDLKTGRVKFDWPRDRRIPILIVPDNTNGAEGRQARSKSPPTRCGST